MGGEVLGFFFARLHPYLLSFRRVAGVGHLTAEFLRVKILYCWRRSEWTHM